MNTFGVLGGNAFVPRLFIGDEEYTCFMILNPNIMLSALGLSCKLLENISSLFPSDFNGMPFEVFPDV